MFLDRLFVFCRNAILDPTERIVELIDKDDAVPSTKLRQTPESKDSSVIMPFTFPVNGLTERSSGTVAYDVRLQVRNATLGWPVVLPSGHLPLRETLMRNQSFFPTFPGAPVVSVGLYHTFTSAEGRILRESSVVWPMTDVASDLGFYLSFVQSILGGIEYILLHDSHRKDIADGLKQLAQDIQEKMTSFVADYEPEDDQQDEQKKRNEAFASEIRETLRVFNILSPTLQLRSKTHALPEDMDREVLQYSPQRLINI